jgi:5-carboxymethyl-2-hydroxymuconate isomerase
MPHIVIEYSSNLRGRLDVEGFVKEVHNAVWPRAYFLWEELLPAPWSISAIESRMRTRRTPLSGLP